MLIGHIFMGYYEIIVENHLDKKRARFFEGMSLENLPDSRTLLYGNLKDQSELFSILNKIRDMNLTLVSVKKDDMKMEVELW